MSKPKDAYAGLRSKLPHPTLVARYVYDRGLVHKRLGWLDGGRFHGWVPRDEGGVFLRTYSIFAATLDEANRRAKHQLADEIKAQIQLLDEDMDVLKESQRNLEIVCAAIRNDTPRQGVFQKKSRT